MKNHRIVEIRGRQYKITNKTTDIGQPRLVKSKMYSTISYICIVHGSKWPFDHLYFFKAHMKQWTHGTYVSMERYLQSERVHSHVYNNCTITGLIWNRYISSLVNSTHLSPPLSGTSSTEKEREGESIRIISHVSSVISWQAMSHKDRRNKNSTFYTS